jgi:hypothetical protein
MKADYEMIFNGENMNPSNTFPWVKLILTHEPIYTQSFDELHQCIMSKGNDVICLLM